MSGQEAPLPGPAFGEFFRNAYQPLAMLIHDPPYSYPEISAALGIPVGSIGPQRARCLDRLRQSVTPALRDNRMLPDSGFMNDRPRPKPRPAP